MEGTSNHLTTESVKKSNTGVGTYHRCAIESDYRSLCDEVKIQQSLCLVSTR